MQTFVIRHRVADFLKRYPPFDSLSESDLLDLAGNARVKFHESDEFIFRQGDETVQTIWVIQQGRVELFEGTEDGGDLRDVLGEGDLLGLECLVGDRRCLRSARTAGDVLLYGIRASQLEWLVSRHAAVKQFFAAHFSVAASELGRSSWLDADPPPLDFLRARTATVHCGDSQERIVSAMIAANNAVVAVIDSAGCPVAILAPHDVIGSEPAPVPLLTIPADKLTTRAAVQKMLHSRAEGLAITAGGSPRGRLDAILTASDLALFCGHNPVSLVRGIRRASSPAEIAPLLAQARKTVRDSLARPQDITDACGMETEVVAALACACFQLAVESVSAAGLNAPVTPCCWVSLSGFARGDQLEPACPMIAAVYDDSAASFRPEDSAWFAAVTGEVVAWFHACGVPASDDAWPDGSHPCMPLSEWTRLYSETIRNPLGRNLYARREFFDLRLLFGDESVLRELQARIAAEFSEHGAAIPLLANDTLALLPPLTFFRGLVLDLDGGESESFDIHSSVISPIVDAARVYALARRRLSMANTLDRLAEAASDYPESASVLNEAADAFRIALYYEAVAGVRIRPRRLGKVDQRILKTAFSATHRFLEATASRFIDA
jgi:CBS domain-containing protein